MPAAGIGSVEPVHYDNRVVLLRARWTLLAPAQPKSVSVESPPCPRCSSKNALWCVWSPLPTVLPLTSPQSTGKMSAIETDRYYIPYEEPPTKTLLVLLGFFATLPVASLVAGRLLRAPLLGPLAMGIVFGQPLTKLLAIPTQEAFAQLGYLGLILMVLHAGLASDLQAAKRNLVLSLVVAATGIVLPIGLSMLLLCVGFGSTPVQAFTAGASLSSTSLGTTFSLLRTAQLSRTKAGSVLTTAALADDVVGLVLLRIVSSLGSGSGGDVSGWQVARPIVVSLALLALSWVASRFVIVPLGVRGLPRVPETHTHTFNLLLGACAVVGVISASAYAGTSVLLGSFVAGLVLATLDSATHGDRRDRRDGEPDASGARTGIGASYSAFVAPIEDYFLAPLFFASIGFSVPLRKLFAGKIVWRGVVYTILMALGKIFCGIWALKLGFPRLRRRSQTQRDLSSRDTPGPTSPDASDQSNAADTSPSSPEDTTVTNSTGVDGTEGTGQQASSASGGDGGTGTTPPTQVVDQEDARNQKDTSAESTEVIEEGEKSSYLFASLVIGFAMTARGEIGCAEYLRCVVRR